VKQGCEVLGVARSNVAAKLARPADWLDGRCARNTDDASLVDEIQYTVADLPSYRYCRVWGLLRRERERICAAPVNAKRVYCVMRVHGLLLQRKPMPPRAQRRLPRVNQDAH
jgi:putative transposase